MERETGLEPATFSLARRRSTTELFPLLQKIVNVLYIYNVFVSTNNYNNEAWRLGGLVTANAANCRL